MLESLSHCMVGRISRALPNDIYPVLPGSYQQNSGILASSHGQGSAPFSWRTSPHIDSSRRLMQYKILKYLKENLPFSRWQDSYLPRIAMYLDDRLLQQATSQEDYMDLTMIVPRLEGLMLCFSEGFANEFSSNAVSSPLSMRSIVHDAEMSVKQVNITSSSSSLTAYPSELCGDTCDETESVLVNSCAYTSLVHHDSLHAKNGNMNTEKFQGSTYFSGCENYPYSSLANSTDQSWQSVGTNFQHVGDDKFSNMEGLIDCQVAGQHQSCQNDRFLQSFNVRNQRQPCHGNKLSLVASSHRVSGTFHHSASQVPELGLKYHQNSSSHGLYSNQDDLFVDNKEIPQQLALDKDVIICSDLMHSEQLSSIQFCGQNLAWTSQTSSGVCIDDQPYNTGSVTTNSGYCWTANEFNSRKESSMAIKSFQHHELGCLNQDDFLQETCCKNMNWTPILSSKTDRETSVHLSKENSTFGINDAMHASDTLPDIGLHKQETSVECMKVDQVCSSNLCWKEEATADLQTSPTKMTRNSVGENVSKDKPMSVMNHTHTMDMEERNYESSSQGSSGTVYDVKTESMDISNGIRPKNHASSLENVGLSGLTSMQIEMTTNKTEHSINRNFIRHSDNYVTKLTDCPRKRINGASLIEWFSASQVREHLNSVRHIADQGFEKAGKNEELVYPIDENTCQLCGLSNICFDVPAIYCASCNNRIGRGRAFYVMDTCEAGSRGNSPQNFFCNQCYKGSHGESIKYVGIAVLKAKLKKKTNDLRAIEPWVQCDKCSSWQHQICGLFNDRRNEGEKAEYICPKCYLQEIENGERSPLPESAVLGAKSLPKSKLSDHIENRLLLRLTQEREERAKSLGKDFNEVPGAENLVVRVVSSLDRKLEVRKLISDVFEEQKYPKEFSYKSKAILLFQNIEGADIFLFGMYVQEYGSNCALPNQRHTYLSYLDSAKFFRPDVKSISGEALRTFVYHEILIGYLEYCKIRGFTCCYIWSCPPLKREDFIFNCHPEKQKMPKTEKLREWYVAMVQKAMKEGIVVHRTNLYDHFFTSSKECLAAVTAARLPYFDGDYWHAFADEVLNVLRREEEGKEPQKKGKITISRRALKAVQNDASIGNARDILLMDKLGDAIRPVKENFMLIHLQHTCNYCCQFIVNGNRWVCNLCKKFLLCDKCHEAEEKLDDKERHPLSSSEKHTFSPVEIAGVPADTFDEDENIQSEILDSRISFLNFCQGCHYQFDALRRAKHSTMMILHHIHTRAVPAFVASCSVCHNEITSGQGWHCSVCPEYDVCNSCYERVGKDHIHRLIGHESASSHLYGRSRTKDYENSSLEQKLLDLLKHTLECSVTTSCTYPFCRRFRIFFNHCAQCKIRIHGGCAQCKKIWSVLVLHSRTCSNPVCKIPRCLDIRNHKHGLRTGFQSGSVQRAGSTDGMRHDGSGS